MISEDIEIFRPLLAPIGFSDSTAFSFPFVLRHASRNWGRARSEALRCV